jgi:hypothetical protein
MADIHLHPIRLSGPGFGRNRDEVDQPTPIGGLPAVGARQVHDLVERHDRRTGRLLELPADGPSIERLLRQQALQLRNRGTAVADGEAAALALGEVFRGTDVEVGPPDCSVVAGIPVEQVVAVPTVESVIAGSPAIRSAPGPPTRWSASAPPSIRSSPALPER